MFHFPLKNFKPQKNLGQNFLHSPVFAADLVEKFQLQQDDVILEIGSGFGVLSIALLQKNHKLCIIEKDARLFNYLAPQLVDYNPEMFCADVLHFDFSQLTEPKYKVVSNLPYAIATKILMLLLNNYARFPVCYLSFPVDLGNRILALPNKKKHNFLNIYCQIFCHNITKIAYLPRTAFQPQPKIDTVFLKFELRIQPLISLKKLKVFVPFLKSSFQYKRKKLINNFFNLQKIKITKFLQNYDLAPTTRAETLNIQQWINLFNLFK